MADAVYHVYLFPRSGWVEEENRFSARSQKVVHCSRCKLMRITQRAFTRGMLPVTTACLALGMLRPLAGRTLTVRLAGMLPVQLDTNGHATCPAGCHAVSLC